MKTVVFYAAATAALACAPAFAHAQSATPAPIPAVPVAPAPAAAPAQMLKIPEGTEMQVKIDEKLTSATAQEGDHFTITLTDPVTIGGVTIPAGFKGRGVVQSAKKRKMMGQAGQLNIALEYIKIGDTKIHVRASKGKEGEGHMGATVALTVLFGPLGLLKHGDDVVIPEGTDLTGYVDEDAELPLPVPPVPAKDS